MSKRNTGPGLRKVPRDSSSARRRAATNFPGQHVLCSRRTIDRMIELARFRPQPLVIDIGAGSGALTLPLANAGWRVLAVENDQDLIAKLRRKTETIASIRVIEQSVLQMPLPGRPFAVVANIPFSITTSILGRLMDHPANAFQRGVLLIQLEAARRFMRKSITDPRILAWRIWFQLDLIQVVSPEHFAPPPRVNAALITASRRQKALVPVQEYWAFLGLAQFALRAPEMPLGQALKGVFTTVQVGQLVKALSLRRDMPICRLTETQWAAVYQSMRQHAPPHRWPKANKPRWFR